MMRLFTALALPEEHLARLSALSAGVDGARWVSPENLHVTLRFIGEVNEAAGDDIVEALAGVRCGPVTVTLEGAGHFGKRKKTYSVWIGVRAAPELLALHDRIDRALASCGLASESRKYTPHVTIARLGRARPDHVRAWLEAAASFAAPPFEAEEFLLYESRPGRSGNVYVPLTEFSLK